jgi:hypothetical protein
MAWCHRGRKAFVTGVLARLAIGDSTLREPYPSELGGIVFAATKFQDLPRQNHQRIVSLHTRNSGTRWSTSAIFHNRPPVSPQRRACRRRRSRASLLGAFQNCHATVLSWALSRSFVPPTPRLAIDSYWRAHPIRADRLARGLAIARGLNFGRSSGGATLAYPDDQVKNFGNSGTSLRSRHPLEPPSDQGSGRHHGNSGTGARQAQSAPPPASEGGSNATNFNRCCPATEAHKAGAEAAPGRSLGKG